MPFHKMSDDFEKYTCKIIPHFPRGGGGGGGGGVDVNVLINTVISSSFDRKCLNIYNQGLNMLL